MIAMRDGVAESIESLDEGCENLGLSLSRLNREIDVKGDKGIYKARAVESLCDFKMPDSLKKSYTYAFHRWVDGIASRGDVESFEIMIDTGVLLGMGNASVHEFGVSLNHPWGVPCIPGSTLKGLVSSYLSRTEDAAWHRESECGVKSDFQVELFGGVRAVDGQAYAGGVGFNDAWLVPYDTPNSWFKADIITVHHPGYYGGNRFPDGTENPVPNKMAVLNKGVTFFVTLLGGEPERRFVRDILVRALGEEGIGGKTAVGYGRFVVNEQSDLWNISRKRREVRERRRRQEAIKKRQSELDAMSPVARALVILKTPGIQEKDAVGIYNGTGLIPFNLKFTIPTLPSVAVSSGLLCG